MHENDESVWMIVNTSLRVTQRLFRVKGVIGIENQDFPAALWLAEPDGNFERDGAVGIASFDTKRGVSLEVPIGSISLNDIPDTLTHEHCEYPRLYGYGRSDDRITLVDAFGAGGFSFPGFPRENWHAQWAIVSREQFFEKDPLVDHATVTVDGLFEWCRQNPVKGLTRYKDGRWLDTEISSSYEALKDIPLYESENMAVSISPVVRVGGGELPLKTQSLTSDYHLSFKFVNDLPTLSVAIHERIIPFRDLLSVLMGFRAEIHSISLSGPGLNKSIKVYIPLVEAHHDSLPKHAFQQMPLTYPKVIGRLQSMTEKWLSLPDDAQRAASILLGFLANQHVPYLEYKFIAAASALEAISRVDHKTTEVEPEEFERRLSVIGKSITEKKARDWAMTHLAHSNSVAAGVLADQMLGELDPYSSFIVPDLKRFKRDHRNARNAYVHQSDNVSNGTAIHGQELHDHTEAVLFLVWGKLLNLLGIPPQELIDALKGSSFRWNDLHLARHMYEIKQKK